MFQTVPDTASFRIVHEGPDGADVVNTIYVKNEVVPWIEASLGAMAATIGNAWRDEVMPLLSNTLNFDRVEGRDEGAQFGFQSVTEYDADGGDITEDLPANVAALVRLTATSGSAPRRGRLFIGGLTIGATQTASVLTATFAADLQAALETVRTQIQGGANEWVLVSRFLNKVKRPDPPGAVTNGVDAISVRLVVASQRDRRPGEGS